MMQPLNIAIAEDNPFALQAVLRKLKAYDDIVIRLVAVNGQQLLDCFPNSPVSVVLMDLEMPVMDGIRATVLLKGRHPHIKVLVLTTFDDDDKVFEAIKSGASGYLLKDAEPERLREAILDVMRGGAPMSPSIAFKVLNMVRNAPSAVPISPTDHGLTKRELEILEQLKNGLTYQQIADNLYISFGTVRKHIDNIYGKLHVSNKVAALQKVAGATRG